MTTITIGIASGADDAHEADDGTGFTSTSTVPDASSNSAAANRKNAGLRFLNVTIPQGSTITAATVELIPPTAKTDDPNCDILAEAVDNAVSFVTNADVTSRARTTASVAWVATDIGAGGSTYRASPSIVTVIQEIVNRAGWVSGNALVLFLDGKTTINRSLTFYGFEQAGNSSLAARLNITYTFPQTISPTGIASTAALGTPTLTPGGVSLTPSGIASTVALGTPSLAPGGVTIAAAGIASTVAFGSSTLAPGAVTIPATGIASTATVGTPTLTAGVVTIAATGIASSTTFGTATLAPGAVTIAATGIANNTLFGAATLTAGNVTIAATGIASTVAFGTSAVRLIVNWSWTGGHITSHRRPGRLTTHHDSGQVTTHYSGRTIVHTP